MIYFFIFIFSELVTVFVGRRWAYQCLTFVPINFTPKFSYILVLFLLGLWGGWPLSLECRNFMLNLSFCIFHRGFKSGCTIFFWRFRTIFDSLLRRKWKMVTIGVVGLVKSPFWNYDFLFFRLISKDWWFELYECIMDDNLTSWVLRI